MPNLIHLAVATSYSLQLYLQRLQLGISQSFDAIRVLPAHLIYCESAISYDIVMTAFPARSPSMHSLYLTMKDLQIIISRR